MENQLKEGETVSIDPANGDVKFMKSTNEVMPSTSDARTVNNVMRHEYRVLTELEKTKMKHVKDLGLVFHDFLESLGVSRDLSLAKTKVEEAVMWAVKHLTR